MNPRQIDFIDAHFHDLITNIICSRELLALLFQGQLLTNEEQERIFSLGTNFNKSHELLTILKTRNNSFDLLQSSLIKLKQSKATAILYQYDEQNNWEGQGSILWDKKDILATSNNRRQIWNGKMKFGGSVAVHRVRPWNLASMETELAQIETFVPAHTHIVYYLCAERTETNFMYMAFEKCDWSIEDYIESSKSEVPLNNFKVIDGATRGLEYLHSIGITHKRLKPSRVLVLKKLNGTDIISKLFYDFSSDLRELTYTNQIGISKTQLRSTSVEQTAWMSPEQLTNKTDLTKKTDIFSMGCIYYYVFTKGRHPFGGPAVVGSNILDGTSCIATDNCTELNPEIENLIRLMINYNPEVRPSTSDLLRYLQSSMPTKL